MGKKEKQAGRYTSGDLQSSSTHKKPGAKCVISPGVSLASRHGREFPPLGGLCVWTSASTPRALLFLTAFCPSPLGCFLRTWRQDRVIAQFTANTCPLVLPQPLIQMFSLPPLLTWALWSLSPELTFIIQLEITPSSRYQLPWEP